VPILVCWVRDCLNILFFFIYKTIICQVPRKLVRTQCLYTSIQVTRYKLVAAVGICSKLVLYHCKLKWPCQERI